MKTFIVKVQETYCVNYKVTAKSKDEAWDACNTNDVHPSQKYDENFSIVEIVEDESWKLTKHNKPPSNVYGQETTRARAT